MPKNIDQRGVAPIAVLLILVILGASGYFIVRRFNNARFVTNQEEKKEATDSASKASPSASASAEPKKASPKASIKSSPSPSAKTSASPSSGSSSGSSNSGSSSSNSTPTSSSATPSPSVASPSPTATPVPTGVSVDKTSVSVTLSRANADATGLVYGSGIKITSHDAAAWSIYNNEPTQGQGFYEVSGGISPGNSTNIRTYINPNKANGTYTGTVTVKYQKGDGVYISGPQVNYSITLTD